jgi:hypothetical protein
MEITTGDVLKINGNEYEVEQLIDYGDMGVFMRWKGIDDVEFPVSRLNEKEYERYLIRRG